MQPDQQYGPPPAAPLPPIPSQPAPAPQPQGQQPNYDFLNNQQTVKSSKIPSLGNSLASKIVVILFCLLLVVILIAVIKSILSPSQFSKTDYLVVVERQQEMIHILSKDITQQSQSQLSQADQNWAATAQLSLQTAQGKTLTFMSDYKDKVDTVKLAEVFDSSIDTQLSNSVSTNTFDSTFKSQMQSQLGYYEKELKASYASTSIGNGKLLLQSEFAEAKLLLSGINSSSS